MRVLFMGSPMSVEPVLRWLVQQHDQKNLELVGVVSQPARPVGRKKIYQDPPVAQFAKNLGLKLWQPEKVSDAESIRILQGEKIDVVITAAYGQILSQAFLDMPSRATINIHPSLLPKYRGATPVPASLLNGDVETGVSILFTVKKLDAGNLIVQRPSSIEPDETAETLIQRLFLLSTEILGEALVKLRDPLFHGEPQSDHAVTHCQKIQKGDGGIDWNDHADVIINKFRAFQPWPGCFTLFGEKRIGITAMRHPLNSWDSSGNHYPETPGRFTYLKEHQVLVVRSGHGFVWVDRLQPAGKKPQDAQGFFNGVGQQGPFHFKPTKGEKV